MTAKPTWDGTRWSDDSPVTDEQKHAWCQRRGYPSAIFLPKTLYAAAEREGFDMRHFVINKPMPCTHPDYSDWDGSQPEPRPVPRMTKAEENALLREIMQ